MENTINLKKLTTEETALIKLIDIIAAQNKIDCFVSHDCLGNTHIIGSDIDYARCCNIMYNSAKLN